MTLCLFFYGKRPDVPAPLIFIILYRELLSWHYPTPYSFRSYSGTHNVCINDDVSTVQRVVPNLIWGTDIINLADLYFLNFKNL